MSRLTCVFWALLLPVLLSASASAWSREGVVVHFDESGHRITRTLHKDRGAEGRLATQRMPRFKATHDSARRNNDRIEVKMVYRDGKIEVLELPDPRILRAPMLPGGGGHEAILEKKRGAYVIPVADSDTILEIEIRLPNLDDKGYRRLSQ
ncbi:MAG: hypothetical protein ACI9GW_003139 [Halieaceae bacterium]|jgi:hypothetical protein